MHSKALFGNYFLKTVFEQFLKTIIWYFVELNVCLGIWNIFNLFFYVFKYILKITFICSVLFLIILYICIIIF